VSPPQQKGRVRPETDRDSAWWWEALSSGRFEVCRCAPHGHYFFPPAPGCSTCGSPDVRPAAVCGFGVVYSWIVVHKALDPAFVGDTPYTIVTVDLDEGARVFGRIENGPLEAGQRVCATIYNVRGITLLGFERA
jgi:uncharacterized OB-fold protein